MVQKNEKSTHTLFTDSLDDDVAALVKRIHIPDFPAVRSHVFATPGDASGKIEWRETQYFQQTKSWSVRTYTGFPSSDEGLNVHDIKSRRIAHDLCLFDALYMVAMLDEAAHAHGQVALQGDNFPSYLITFHHREIAEKYGIPYDRYNMPLPASNGTILTDGDYNGKAIAVAQASGDNLLPAVASSVTPSFGELVPVDDSGTALPIARNLRDVADAKRNYELSVEVLNQSTSGLGYALKKNFERVTPSAVKGYKRIAGAATAPILTAGAVAGAFAAAPSAWIIAFGGAAFFGIFATAMTTPFAISNLRRDWNRTEWQSPLSAPKKTMRDLDNFARQLPQDSVLRKEVEQLRDEVNLAYHALYLRQVFNDASKNKWLGWKLGHEMKKFEKLCERLSVSEPQYQWLLENVQSPVPGQWSPDKFKDHLTSHISQHANNIRSIYDEAFRQQLKSLPKPQQR